jgi:hypothetical protein
MIMKKQVRSRFAVIMQTTAAVSALLTGLFLLLYFRLHSGWLLSIAVTFGTTFYHFAMRLLVGTLVPNTLSCNARWFQQRPWESDLYRKLKVKNWKKHLPTYDPDAFSLDLHTPEQILANMCQAEVVHEIIVLCSFLPLAAVPFLGALPVFLITSILSAAADLIFTIAQRYNRPRILRLSIKRAAIQSQRSFHHEGND